MKMQLAFLTKTAAQTLCVGADGLVFKLPISCGGKARSGKNGNYICIHDHNLIVWLELNSVAPSGSSNPSHENKNKAGSGRKCLVEQTTQNPEKDGEELGHSFTDVCQLPAGVCRATRALLRLCQS